MSIHIERVGDYIICDNDRCELPIHLPLDTVEEAQALPYPMLLNLVEAIEPPNVIDPSGRWRQWIKPGAEPQQHHYHRDYDLPAVIYSDGSMQWYQNGQYHRGGDKPAYVGADGAQMWWLRGKIHRENDLPAKIWADGTQEWYAYSSRHREGDKPAVIHPNGSVEYWCNNELHRWRGPAITFADGTHEWHWYGIRIITPREHIARWRAWVSRKWLTQG